MRTAPRRSRWSLRIAALGYLAALLIAPVTLIFYKTFEHGLAKPIEAITTPTPCTRCS